jgi:hypothetical protein
MTRDERIHFGAHYLRARAINAAPWEPLPGMVKKQCRECQYLFAAPAIALRAMLRCPDCATTGLVHYFRRQA